MTVNKEPAVSVVRAVAAVERTEPERLRPPLASAVDPDAIESICRHGARDCRIEFTYCGHDVAVDGTGTVEIDGEAFTDGGRRHARQR
jgi:hypothetical protein